MLLFVKFLWFFVVCETSLKGIRKKNGVKDAFSNSYYMYYERFKDCLYFLLVRCFIVLYSQEAGYCLQYLENT